MTQHATTTGQPSQIVSDIKWQGAAQDGTVDTAIAACDRIQELCHEPERILFS